MKIFITGGKGRIGGFLASKLSIHHEVYAPGKHELDITNYFELHKVIESKNFDVLIHTAVIGGRRNSVEVPENLYKNIQMTQNIKAHLNDFSKIIVFDSGASSNRKYDVNPKSKNPPPTDYYGLAKLVEKQLLTGENVLSLRIFNCFGPTEEPDRFIKTCINNCLLNKDIDISQDRLMDFFFEDDLLDIVRKYLDGLIPSGKYDCSYVYVEKLSRIANTIKNLTKSTSKINIGYSFGNSFFGSHFPLCNYVKDNIGLQNGIIKTIESLK